MEIQTAIEGRQACERLYKELGTIRYSPDMHKMFRNIMDMVTEVSKKEVISRRTRSRHVLTDPLKQLNQSIDYLEKLIIMAKLME